MRDKDDDYDEDDPPRQRKRREKRSRDDDYDEDDSPRDRSADGRTYLHNRCGGLTQVTGGDYGHICDPFRICTGTYCCTCEGFVPLRDVEWADTGETVTKYRRRMRQQTPGLVTAWRLGLGAILGALFGAGLGVACASLFSGPPLDSKRLTTFGAIGALVGAAVFHVAGGAILKAIYRIDYRRME